MAKPVVSTINLGIVALWHCFALRSLWQLHWGSLLSLSMQPLWNHFHCQWNDSAANPFAKSYLKQCNSPWNSFANLQSTGIQSRPDQLNESTRYLRDQQELLIPGILVGISLFFCFQFLISKQEIDRKLFLILSQKRKNIAIYTFLMITMKKKTINLNNKKH